MFSEAPGAHSTVQAFVKVHLKMAVFTMTVYSAFELNSLPFTSAAPQPEIPG